VLVHGGEVLGQVERESVPTRDLGTDIAEHVEGEAVLLGRLAELFRVGPAAARLCPPEQEE
jgi:hypothetical protein